MTVLDCLAEDAQRRSAYFERQSSRSRLAFNIKVQSQSDTLLESHHQGDA